MGDFNLKQVYDDIGGMHEICQRLGVSRDRIIRWVDNRANTHCPLPIRTLRNMYLYSLSEWDAWFQLWVSTRGTHGKKLNGRKPNPNPVAGFNPGNWRKS